MKLYNELDVGLRAVSPTNTGRFRIILFKEFQRRTMAIIKKLEIIWFQHGFVYNVNNSGLKSQLVGDK